ncbi:MAG TPA: hypothetical protein VJO35_10770 [Terriglobales bacterium]|nr:hypothetical protein [Terriglobales bacterium]
MPTARVHLMKTQSCSIRHEMHDGFEAVVIENGFLRLAILPELGGKIVSLARLESGHEFLLQSAEPKRAYQLRSYGAKFEDYDRCGFDECVPTVAECLYPEEPFLAGQLPDHGDVWSLPSKVEIIGEQILCTTTLRSLPLLLMKKVQLQVNTVRMDYEVKNLNQSTVKFLWSAHPLLRVEPEAEIILPREVHEVEVSWSKDERLGKAGDRCTWPKATDRFGRIVELNKIFFATGGTAEKLFTSRLSEGFCGMFLPRANESITMGFDARSVPYLGIWVCQGGWPAGRAAKDFTIALEPCNGRPDSLKEAIDRNECATLPGYGTVQWWMEIEVNSGPPRLWV